MFRSLFGALVAVGLSVAPVAAVTVETIYKFNGTDGRSPEGLMSIDANGVLYGTTLKGGAANFGTVFRLAPPQPGSTRWTRQTLHAFRDAPDGAFPMGGVTLAPDGSLFGATAIGGLGHGTIYRLAPPAAGETRWTYRTIYTFDPSGSEFAPLAPVLAVSGGAVLVGSGGCGAIFRLQPPKAGATTWTRKDLANSKTFGKCMSFREAAPIPYGNGELVAAAAEGALVRLTPPAIPGQAWQVTASDQPPLSRATLCCRDATGRIFGIESGDWTWPGRVFAFDPPAEAGGSWTKTYLQTLGGLVPYDMPHALVRSGKSLFGVTRCCNDAGTLYRLDPPKTEGAGWTYSLVVAFGSGAAVGIDPSNLTVGPGGVLYGTTIAGNGGNGTIFRVVP